jgi:hypothetical protein
LRVYIQTGIFGNVTLRVAHFATEAGRCPPKEFLDELPVADSAAIVADIVAFSTHAEKAPISMKPIKGHKGLWEIRTRGLRTLYALEEGTMWVLHVCRKQDQRRGIDVAAERLKKIRETTA